MCRMNVAVALGATSLSLSLVLPGGVLNCVAECIWLQQVSGDDPDGLVWLIAQQVKEVAAGQPIGLVGISTKGPVSKSEVNGLVMVGPWKSNRPFSTQWPFEERLRDALTKLGVRYEQTQMLHDGVAALLGEMRPRGTLAGQSSGCVVIWGTGIGVAIRERGETLKEIGRDEPGDDLLRVLGSLGRHLVYAPGLPDPLRYEYRGIPLHHSTAPLQSGEMWLSERLAGPWLARRIAGELLACHPDQQKKTLDCMEAQQVNLQGFSNQKHRDEVVEILLLAGLTTAARKGDDWARTQIALLGTELGAALAAFAWAFQDREAVDNIVLVSTIAERLGLGIEGHGGQGDLLIENLRESITSALAKRGMDKERATAIALGVRRSKLSRERELLAFDPTER